MPEDPADAASATALDAEKSTRASLAEVAKIAADRGWTSVTEFAVAVPAGDARDVAILTADEVDARPLSDWIRQAGTTISVAPLAPLADEAGPVLAPNRVLVALRCGLMLTADDATVAASVMLRPEDTYRIVLTGAEDITSAEDLELVERGVWRTLLEPDGEAWQGQDIAARGCLLWADQEVAAVVRHRVAVDGTALRDWLAAPVIVPDRLDQARTDHAATLALEALDAGGLPLVRADPAGSDEVTGQREEDGAAAAQADAALRAVRLVDLAAEVRGLHERLLSRMDADAALTERQVLASLQTLEQDLQSSAAGWSADYAEHSIRKWAAETDQMIAQRTASARDDARHLLARAEWDRVNQVSSRAGADRYPDVILDELGQLDTRLSAGALPAVHGPLAAPGEVGGDLLGALRSVNGGMIVTAGLGAAVLGLFGLPLLPVAGAAALGLAGGAFWEARHRAEQDRQRARQAASTRVGSAGAGASTAIAAVLHEQAAALRVAVDRRFAEAERALDEAAARDEAVSPVSSSARPDDVTSPASASSTDGDERLRSRLRTLINDNQI
jgi:hypothetical protein